MVRIAHLVAAAALAAGPPGVLFKDGYNLCHAAKLAAIRAAGGQPYKAGLFANKSCLWERADLKAGVSLSTHPRAVGLALIHQFLTQQSTTGIKATRVQVAGATDAVIATLPHSLSTTIAKDIVVAYRKGAVQINMNAPRTLPDSRLFAVLAVIT